jgi:hypothetical protein
MPHFSMCLPNARLSRGKQGPPKPKPNGGARQTRLQMLVTEAAVRTDGGQNSISKSVSKVSGQSHNSVTRVPVKYRTRL